MDFFRGILLLALILATVNSSYGLKCYTCSITEDDADTSCADNPSAIDQGWRDCDKKYCTIVRIDYKDPRGKLASLTRSCADQLTYANDVIEDETNRAYYRSCRTDLCNSGSGRTESTSAAGASLGDKSTIYCPGTGAGHAAAGSTAALLAAVIFAMLWD